jgi:uncharacterized protein with von Willebrand factor type A (vWA) domain
VTGIVQGDDLSRLLPSEALYAIDPELEVIFARRMQERALMNYELNKTPPKEQGPIVMLLDSSGSMATPGTDADVWGAAVALAYLEIAQRQGRAFCLMHFGREVIEQFEFPAKAEADINKVIEAATFFEGCGGTDFANPLDTAAAYIAQSTVFENADIVLVTDGGARVNDTWLSAWNKKRADQGFNLYSILVGNDTDPVTTAKVSDKVVELASVTDDEEMHSLFGEV